MATCSSDGTLKIFDLRVGVTGGSSYAPANAVSGSFDTPVSLAALTVPASGTEILTLDWNKYRPFMLASGGVDKTVKIWDCRMVRIPPSGAPPVQEPIQEVGGVCEIALNGHEYAVRKVQWSPHRPDVLASASYDMSCRMWAFFCFEHERLNTDQRRVAGARPRYLDAVIYCEFTMLIPSLLLDVVGPCMMKEYSRVVAGIAEQACGEYR